MPMDSEVLKKHLSAKGKDDLTTLLMGLYEKGEEKTRNRILRHVVPASQRPKKGEPIIPTAEEYMHEVHAFCENALAGNYYGPNRNVSKKERS